MGQLTFILMAVSALRREGPNRLLGSARMFRLEHSGEMFRLEHSGVMFQLEHFVYAKMCVSQDMYTLG
jgi:hypothetical protein